MNNAFLLPKEFVNAPEALSRRYSHREAVEYTRWLATHHYENFHIVTFLLPRRLRQDFYNVYAFCRWADDLGDEIGDRAESLRLLKWWQEEMEAMYEGRAGHPVFIALQDTVERHDLPQAPFADLIRAFMMDQIVTRYHTLEELVGYCQFSASPVGRLVLYLCGYSDPERQKLSDATCIGLQLANFWQDVTLDWEKDRVYVPIEVLERHGSSVDDIRARRATPGFRAAMKEAVELTRKLFLKGLPLARMVDRRLALDVDLFSRGGLRVLEKIERRDYDVLSRRPVILRAERVVLLAGSLFRAARWRAA